tara:strand:- start:391 stop:972 length:582 start_codon:yes stop_codon:yes gene_type:complete
MLTKIKIYGPLRRFCNNQRFFEAAIKKPIDAISFLKCNFKGLDKHMANQHYCIKVRGEEITENNLHMNMSGEIQIIPIAHGNFFPLLLGAGALFAGSAISGGVLATVAASVLTSIGTSLVIGGITEMLSPTPSQKRGGSGMDETDPAAYAANYSFSGLTNVSRAGIPVNCVFGEIFVGSITISNGVDVVQVKE